MKDELGISIRMSDGADVSVRVYRPDGDGPFPTLFAASPYRYDNDDVPPTMVFFWHEVGAIHWHEVIEWIAAQPWSNGKIGGIGQSYYAAAQWFMAERPPHLTCIAPYDGHIDYYRGWFYSGGIQSNFLPLWWENSVRPANKSPFNGQHPRLLTYDLCADVMEHDIIDAFWDDRSICCADSTVTDLQFGHVYTPDMVGTDTYHHSAKHPSRLLLPMLSVSRSGA